MAVWVSLFLGVLISGCDAAKLQTEQGRRIYLDSQLRNRQLVCAEPQPSEVTDWPSYDPYTLAPAPYELLYRGGFLVCRAHQQKVISGIDYRNAERDRPNLLLKTLAAVNLSRLGETDEASRREMRDWHVNSIFFRVVCQTLMLDEFRSDLDALDHALQYCAALINAHVPA